MVWVPTTGEAESHARSMSLQGADEREIWEETLALFGKGVWMGLDQGTPYTWGDFEPTGKFAEVMEEWEPNSYAKGEVSDYLSSEEYFDQIPGLAQTRLTLSNRPDGSGLAGTFNSRSGVTGYIRDTPNKSSYWDEPSQSYKYHYSAEDTALGHEVGHAVDKLTSMGERYAPRGNVYLEELYDLTPNMPDWKGISRSALAQYFLRPSEISARIGENRYRMDALPAADPIGPGGPPVDEVYPPDFLTKGPGYADPSPKVWEAVVAAHRKINKDARVSRPNPRPEGIAALLP